jgi:hypothetical protein
MWAVYPVTVAVLLLILEAGFRFGRARRQKTKAQSDAGLGGISGATLGLLAFLLAITVGFGMDLYGERRALVLDEANAIHDSYLRTGYLVEPYHTQSRDLLGEYLDWRLLVVEDQSRVEEVRTRSEEIQAELWELADKYVLEVDDSDTVSAYVDSLYQVVDVHARRVVKGLQVNIPPLILLGLYGITVLAMFLAGMQAGYVPERSVVGLVTMVLALSVVLYLVVDLSRAQEGLLTVSHQPLIDLKNSLPSLP